MNLNFSNQTNQKKWYQYKGELENILNLVIDRFDLDQMTQVSCILVDDKSMHQYNLNYRQIDRSTDVLTFVDENQPNYLGDIIINVEAITLQAKEYDHTIKREICFLFTHGLLHALGYDHHTSSDEAMMISEQKEILSHVSKRSYRKSNS